MSNLSSSFIRFSTNLSALKRVPLSKKMSSMLIKLSLFKLFF